MPSKLKTNTNQPVNLKLTEYYCRTLTSRPTRCSSLVPHPLHFDVSIVGEYTYWSRAEIPPNPTFIVNTVPFQDPRLIHPLEGSAVSATSYALLVYLANNRIEEATSIMKWLQTMRNSIGGWGATQVLAFIRSFNRSFIHSLNMLRNLSNFYRTHRLYGECVQFVCPRAGGGGLYPLMQCILRHPSASPTGTLSQEGPSPSRKYQKGGPVHPPQKVSARKAHASTAPITAPMGKGNAERCLLLEGFPCLLTLV